MRTFFCREDFELFRWLLTRSCAKHGVDIWAYCFMPNHAHAVAVPESPEALRLALGEAHKLYSHAINQREGWRGHLWQCRFSSCPMDARHTLAAARYIELNPVRAGLVASAAEYEWSSARAHLFGANDRLVRVEPLLTRVPAWAAFLGTNREPELLERLRRHAASGMPLGDLDFVEQIEARVGRIIVPRAA